MAALPECDAYGYIYDTSGGPAVGVLVTLKHVDDVANNPILLKPEFTETDDQGAYHFTLPQLATAYISARATNLWDCNGGIPFKVPAAPSGELAPILVPPPEAESFSVQPPLHYAANVLSISQATASSDGYLTQEDWQRFDEGAGAMPGGTGTELQYRLDANSFGAFPSSIDAFGLTLGNYLTLNGNPISTFHAATKNYVDQAIATIPPLTGANVIAALGYTPVNKAGDTMLGFLTLFGPPVAPLHAATRDYVDSQIAAIPLPPPFVLDTAADYYWTGKHEFTQATKMNIINSRVGGFMSFTSDSTISMNATSASGQMQFNGPSGSAFRIDSSSAKITHNGQIILSLTSIPAGGASLIFQCFDNSFTQRAHYFMNDSGRHFFNAPAIVDTGNAAVTIYANDTHGAAFGQALLLNGPAVLGVGASLHSTYPSGYVTQVIRQDASGFYFTGPIAADGGGASGVYVLHCCGTGAYEGAPGSVNQHGPNATWYYSAHIVFGAGGGYFLTLSADPTAALHAATKQYVDGRITAHTHPIFSTTAPGFVPQPLVTDASKFLTGAGTWASAAAGAVDTAANYAWTGLHTFSQSVNILSGGNLFLRNGGAVESYFSTGVPTTLLHLYTDNVMYIGPFESTDGGAGGATVLIRAGRGNTNATVSLNGATFQAVFGFHTTFTGTVTLAADPVAPLQAATKQYVDAHSGGGSGSVDVTANYAWTGNHSWTKTLNIFPTVHGGLLLQAGAAGICPIMSFAREDATGMGSIGLVNTAGAIIPTTSVADIALSSFYGSVVVGCAIAQSVRFVFGDYTSNATPVTLGWNALSINSGFLSVNTPYTTANNARFFLKTTGMPEFALAFTNALDSSVNFQTVAPGTAGNGNTAAKGLSYITVYGDFCIGSYIDQSTVNRWIYFLDPQTPGGLGTVVFGQSISANQFFKCQVDNTTTVFAVATNGDVTLAHDPTSALHASTKQYCDNKLLKSGGTMTGILTLSGNPVGVLDAVPKQYSDLNVPKAGGTMTGLLVLSADASAALNPVSKQQLDARHAPVGANGSNATVLMISELLTLSTAGLTTDTVGNLLPAGAIILSVTARITTTITTTTDWKLGDATTADRFTAANATKTSGTTTIGLNQWNATRVTAGMGPDQAAAAKVRVTCTGSNPGAGAIRISVWYIQLTAPTS